MAFCTKCGATLTEGAAFCPVCGQPVVAEAASGQNYQQTPPQQDYQQVPPQQGYQQQQGGYQQQGYQQGYQPPYQNYADPAWDAQNNKVYGVLAYIGILVLVTILAAPKESRFSKFHANQGLILLIVDAGGAIALSIIGAVLIGIGTAISGGLLVTMSILIGLLWTAFGVMVLILVIMGIVNAAKGEMKPLPIIGKYTILK